MRPFKISAKTASKFAKLIDAISTIADQAIIYLDDDKLVLKAMDSAHICLIYLELPKNFFKDWTSRNFQEIPINVSQLNQILKKSDNETLYLWGEANENKFGVTFIGNFKRVFRIGILSDYEEVNLDPFTRNEVQFNLTPENLYKIVDSACIIGDYIRLTFSEHGRNLNAVIEGTDCDLSVDFDEFLGDIVANGIQVATYSLEYLKDMMKARIIAEQVKFEFSTDLPIKLDFSLGDHGHLIYFLSPRSELDEDYPETEEIEPTKSGSGDSDLDFLPELPDGKG